MKRVCCLLFFVVLVAACTKIDRLATVNAVTNQDTLKLSKQISPASIFLNGATATGEALKHQVIKVDRLSNTVSFNKKINFAASVQLTLEKDSQTIVITATTNNDTTTEKAIADFKVELAKRFE